MKADTLRKISPFIISPAVIALFFLRCFYIPALGFIDSLLSDMSATGAGSLQTRYSFIELYNLISRLKKADTAGTGAPVYAAYLILMMTAIAAVIFLYFAFILYLMKNKTAHIYYKIGLCCAVISSTLTILGTLSVNFWIKSYFIGLGNIILPTFVPACIACIAALGVILIPPMRRNEARIERLTVSAS